MASGRLERMEKGMNRGVDTRVGEREGGGGEELAISTAKFA